MEELEGGLASQIERELSDYFTKTVSVSEDYNFSQNDLTRRISLFENHIYPTGKFDKQGNYKFWYDIISPRIDSEVKNIDFDTKDINIFSERKIDALPITIVNLKLNEWLKENGQADEIDAAIEEGSGWGNIVWKKVKDGYERVDLNNFYVINQTAKTLKETPVIERHEYSQSDLRAKSGTWKNVAEVMRECKQNSHSATLETTSTDTTTPYYEIYERNGEVCLKDLKKERGETVSEGDEDRYVLAKIIGAGTKSTGSGVKIKYLLYTDTINEMPYEEYHRGRYKGRWFREGLYELLFDLQVRANQIGNQIARGLEFASKIIFTTEDKLIVQNALTDLNNGDIVRLKGGLSHVPVRIEGMDQLVNDWNRIIELANDIANSREVVQGETLPSSTPFRLGALLNQNANKLFDFFREKLGNPLSRIFERWVIPELIKDLKLKEIIRLVGEGEIYDRLIEMVVEGWYINNLVAIGPHDKQFAETIKAEKINELKKKPEILIKDLEELWKGFKPSVSVIITGENSRLPEDLVTISTFIQLEQDPIRRQALIEKAMRMKGIDIGSLPKSEPMALQQP